MMKKAKVNRMGTVPRAGFTLIELMVVIAIIAVLMGLAIPVYHLYVSRSKVWTSRQVVQLVASAIAGETDRTVILADGRRRARFDADAVEVEAVADAQERLALRGLIDGDPATDPAWAAWTVLRPAVQEVGYRGFGHGIAAKLPTRAVDRHGRPIDAWGRPLRLRYDMARFPPSGVGVWSDGRNGIPEEGAGDDLTSWSER